ncbi:glycosyltransferase family 4 protein, partial [Candidatus Uhrbacteria bacterium]|nr:glycosyltransferase family 4 protein [Candidatus Uhrbacteria bacterium]
TSHYTYYLVKHLLEMDHDNTYVLFFDRAMKDIDAIDPASRVFHGRNVVHRFLPFGQYKRWLPFVYTHTLVAAALARERLDVYHTPAHPIPLGYRRPSVVTVHDLLIYEHPEWFPAGRLGGQEFAIQVAVPSSIRRASVVVTPSRATATAVANRFHVEPKKLRVIPEGIVEEPVEEGSVAHVRTQFGITSPYIFFIGTIEPRKNLVRAIDAFVEYRKRNGGDSAFIIAGGKGWKNDDVFGAIDRANATLGARAVRYIGVVTHADKCSLIAGAELFLWPSLGEGFGLPLLEAMALGTPVITSNVTSIPEVAGGAALLVDPLDTSAIADVLTRLMQDQNLRDAYQAKGSARSRQFSWEATARATHEVYREVAERT